MQIIKIIKLGNLAEWEYLIPELFDVLLVIKKFESIVLLFSCTNFIGDISKLTSTSSFL